MDNSHIFQVSQQCRSLLLPQPLQLLRSQSLLTARRIWDADLQRNMCKQMCVRACTHTPHTFLHSREMAGNTEKREGGSKRLRTGSSFTAGRLQKSSRSPSAAQGNRPAGRWNLFSPGSPFTVRQITSGVQWYKGLRRLVWFTRHPQTRCSHWE